MADSSTITEYLLQAALRYVEHGNIQGLREILLELAHVREGGKGRSLIHAAAEVGRADMLEVLLDAGADPNMAEGERIEDMDRILYQPGHVPLHYAARVSEATSATDWLTADRKRVLSEYEKLQRGAG